MENFEKTIPAGTVNADKILAAYQTGKAEQNVRLLNEFGRLLSQNARLLEALKTIESYDEGNGCCPYGCDCPTIAELAIAESGNQQPTQEVRLIVTPSEFGIMIEFNNAPPTP